MSGSFSGGAGLARALEQISRNVAKGAAVKVGFLEGSTTTDGESLPMIAATLEFGATIKRQASSVTVYRKLNKSKTGFAKKGRFVKRKNADFSSEHQVGEYTITIPARPYFRNMIAKNSPNWPARIAAALRAGNYDGAVALKSVGQSIKDDLQQSIRATDSPPNAKSTIRKKGFNKPLIDTGHMLRSVSYEVKS